MAELEALRTYEHRRVTAAIERHLAMDPFTETRNKKCLGDQVTADFDYVPPLWELRVGEHRVFYAGEAENRIVVIQAVRRKPPHKTTSEVIDETAGD